MKMINVFKLMADNVIKDKTEIVIYYDSEAYVYKYHKLYQTFLNEDSKRMEEEFVFGVDFLNFEVDLIPPEEKKYLIKVNVRGLATSCEYLNYLKPVKGIVLSDRSQSNGYKTRFTKKEMRDIKQVREFLEDMEGKYQLIEAK